VCRGNNYSDLKICVFLLAPRITGIEHLRQKKEKQGIADDEFFKKNPAYNSRILNGLFRILELLGSTGDEAFDGESYDAGALVTAIRSEEDCSAFESFCVLCLKHIVGTSSWRQNFRREAISDAFTISDEAFAFLVLDNNKDYWKLCYEVGEHNIPVVQSTSASGRATKRRKVDTRYTKRGSAGGTQGWNKEGIDTYNKLLKEVINNRSKNESKELESRIQRQWNDDRMNHLQGAGRVLNQMPDGEEVRQHMEIDADIVDTW